MPLLKIWGVSIFGDEMIQLCFVFSIWLVLSQLYCVEYHLLSLANFYATLSEVPDHRFQITGALTYYWNELYCTSTLTVSAVKLQIREGKQGADGSFTASLEITNVHVCSWQAGRCSWAVHDGTWQTSKSWRKPSPSFCGSFWEMWTEAGIFSLRDRQHSLKHHKSCQ